MSNIRSIWFTQFFHRRNNDSTFDSICGLCFETIATAAEHEVLRLKECAHRCPKSRWSASSRCLLS
jgi:hypothetical protein